jgi:site-specific recombinase XerC
MIRDDDARIDMTKVRMELPPDERIRRDRPYTIEEIQAMLSVCGSSDRTREKVIILLLTSTGMRLGVLHSLQVGDLVPKDTPQGKVYYITVYSSSSKSYQTPCNCETASVIDLYLRERTGAGESMQNDCPLLGIFTTL